MAIKHVEKQEKFAGARTKELAVGVQNYEIERPKKEEPMRQRKNDLRAKLKMAIELNDLCYDCETGFHYMKQ